MELQKPQEEAAGEKTLDPASAAPPPPMPAIDEPATDAQKKARRAERFGMPVQLSEEEKRNSRAERFGTASVLHGGKDAGNMEEQKRKARAERFGLSVQSKVDEEAKKKARIERFTQDPKTNSLEEDRRKAREVRFAPKASISSESNNKDNSELKTAVAET